jgi:hypothetical protein
MGTTTEPIDYSFVDENTVIVGQAYYYWLESISTTYDLELYGPVSLEIPIQGNTPHTIQETCLDPNFPNPFNPRTMIKFSIEEGEQGTLSIYNVKGQIILHEEFETGEYNFEWNADGLSSGVYFYTLKTNSNNIIRKMMLIK